MSRKYLKLNQIFRKALWIIVIIGLISTIPILNNRNQIESTSKSVELTFDYSDLIETASYEENPDNYIKEQLTYMKKSGINAFSVNESSLDEMIKNQYIKVLTSDDFYKYTNIKNSFNENFTYIFFEDKQVQTELEPLIKNGFEKVNVKTFSWKYDNLNGVCIQLGQDKAKLVPLQPNPINIRKLNENGFEVIVRLSNRLPFNEIEMEQWFNQFQKYDVKRIVIDGEEAPGYSSYSHKDLDIFSNLLNKYKIGLAIIEMSNKEQKGLSYLAKKTAYNLVRLHSISDNETSKFAEQIMNRQDNLVRSTIIDRLVLAVKDRNIRIILINSKPVIFTDRKTMINPLPVILSTLNGEQGVISRIQALGYHVSSAEAFKLDNQVASRHLLNMAILLGAIAIVVLLLSYFYPQLSLLLYILGILLSIFINFVAYDKYLGIMSLIVAISAPSLAMIRTIHNLQRDNLINNKFRLAYSLKEIGIASAVSLIGVTYVVSFLDHISFMLVLQQFRGVTIVHVIPILIVVGYLLINLFKDKEESLWVLVKKILSTNINIFMLISLTALVGILGYYISRTGNSGQVLNIEYTFRSFLENTIGTRPRTKEFLISHPLFILSIYLSIKHRKAIFLVVAGIIGQISIVNTFLHIHTPLMVSLTRVLNGLWLGILVGLILIMLWELCSRSWSRWQKKLR